MGCISSNPSPTTIPSNSNIPNFTLVAQQVKQTWPDVKKIDRLGAKIFAYLLYKYPELRTSYHIPEAYKTQADLLNANEIKQASDNFISLYSDIIENSDTRFDEIIREKAVELYGRGIRTFQVKYYGESLVHVINYELRDELNIEEKQAWQLFTKHVSDCLLLEIAKFPRKSIV
ncbi:unnamed protein product [Rotaria sordida]|uniref:Hemoglobin n=1 Tax=Rotaria sordida TaxID=392033 RepID=A0A814XUC3_9BILA|nr:unnamed protein product [Rotaria sordida]CAF4114522.1 unnamed protein product [Rotaria sordida]